MKTARQRRGAAAEETAAGYVATLGWRVVGRNVKVGRDEIDLLCLDPGPPPELVVVEVRSLRTPAFGAPEERVDGRKVRRLYRAAAALGPQLDRAVGRLPRRVDLVVIDGRNGRLDLRHLRRLVPD